MDPNEALKRIRAQVRELRSLVDNEDLDAEALAMSAGTLLDAADGLDEWLSRGGFLPWDWTPPEPGGNDPHERLRETIVRDRDGAERDLSSEVPEVHHHARGMRDECSRLLRDFFPAVAR